MNWVKISGLVAGLERLLEHLGQPRQLARAAGDGRVVAEELRGVVADLLELGEGRQDQPLALDALGRLELLGGVLDDGLVERGLLLGQRAEDLHLELVGQVGDDRLVGLEPAEDERAGQALEASGGLGVAVDLDRHVEAPA